MKRIKNLFRNLRNRFTDWVWNDGDLCDDDPYWHDYSWQRRK